MRVHIHIDRLVLNGLPIDASASASMRRAIEVELGRLIAQQPNISPELVAGGAADLRTSRVKVKEGQSPKQLGKSIARSLHGGLSK